MCSVPPSAARLSSLGESQEHSRSKSQHLQPCCRIVLDPRLQGCVGRGDELVSENLRLRTEAASLEEAEERVARGECWGTASAPSSWQACVI